MLSNYLFGEDLSAVELEDGDAAFDAQFEVSAILNSCSLT